MWIVQVCGQVDLNLCYQTPRASHTWSPFLGEQSNDKESDNHPWVMKGFVEYTEHVNIRNIYAPSL